MSWTPPTPDEDPELHELYERTNQGETFEQWWLAGFEGDDDGPVDTDDLPVHGPSLYDLDDDAELWFLYADATEGETKPMPLDEWYRERYEPDQPDIEWMPEWPDDETLDGMIRDVTESADFGDDIDYEALSPERVDEVGELLTEALPQRDPDDCSFGPHHWGDQCHACGYGQDLWDNIAPEDFEDRDDVDHLEDDLHDDGELEFSIEDRTMISAWLDDELRSEWLSETDGRVDFLEWVAEHEDSDIFIDRAWDASKGMFAGQPGELAGAPPDDPDEWWRLGFDHADMLQELAEWESITGDVLEDPTTEVDDQVLAELDVEDFEDVEVRAELWDAELVARGNEWGWDGWQDPTGDPGWGGDTWGGDGWGDGRYGDGWGGDAFDFGNSFEFGEW